ncbi:Hydrogenase maturation factor HypB [Sporomusa silvacetica DSM 10669]|uniref:Hydrogenase maturation factor HypB n=1 Tax=Sporomusa silvacetica DSM 10669 TaxID=1123289 RepID=A0ABZ3IKR3_9FIRM|nr:hydrogenase nickel incorporation protein HypB [Sporomusa silvacetica]OZC13429.1 hydrogenase isoenzymes nickel incorporation protein HypB [Sporomusa silvacetica DSM 10669]
METIRLIEVKKEIFSDNNNCAQNIRADLKKKNVSLVNIMASPGSGKTSTILQTIDKLKQEVKIAVIEGDIESLVDSEKVTAAGVKAIQINTGGSCHLDAVVVQRALNNLNLEEYDLIFVENIGNLVCPAEFDIGERFKVMILSVPEGDDKILKYPLMFSVCDVLIINKIDYLPDEGFDPAKLRERVLKLNPNIQIFEISCRTRAGVDAWCNWLKDHIK